jgi:phosphate acetyltransferase
MTSADSAQTLLGIEPRVVMLSFSTNRSAKHAMVDKVVAASEIVKQRRPDMLIDGDTQFDAGIVPEIAASKAPGSRVAGQGNVMIFPNLMAGNIGYKIAQRLGGAKAIGPILQGLKKPANDLSRGCSPDDVFRVAAVTAVQAQAAES